MTTQFSFMAVFWQYLGGAYYFTLMKNTVSIEYQSIVVTSAVYCFMGAVMYAYINYKYGVGSDALKNGHYPTVLRYIDWIVTTPLIVLKFPQLLSGSKGAGAIATLVIVADFIMIIFGFIGETSININNITSFDIVAVAIYGISMLAWIFILYYSVTTASADKLGPI